MDSRNQSTDLVLCALAAAGGLALGLFAFGLGGFVSMGFVGVLIGFLAVRLDLEKESVGGGPPSPHLYAKQVALREQMTRAERASHAADIRSLWRPLVVAKTISVGLIVFGFGAYFFFD